MSTLPAEEENALREYFCVKAYLEAVASFDEWFPLFHRGKPEAPGDVAGATFTEKIAHEQRVKAYEAERGRWQQRLDEQVVVDVGIVVLELLPQ